MPLQRQNLSGAMISRPEVVFLGLLLVCGAVARADRAASRETEPVAPKPRSFVVKIESVRMMDGDIKDLGFDWLLPRRVDGKGGAELCGMFLKTQFDVLKRAVNSLSKPPVWLSETKRVPFGPLTVESSWDDKKPAFTVSLKEELGDIEVTLKGEKPQTAVVSPGGPSVLLFEVPSIEKGRHAFYFVTVDASTAPFVNLSRRPGIEIRIRVAQVPEAIFVEHEKELEKAVRAGDEKALTSLKGVDLMTTPTVTMVPGQTATISVVREYRYPVSFEAGPTDVLSPTAFDAANLGVTFTADAALSDGKINLHGELVVRDFEGLARGDLGTFAPTFQSTEANVFRVLDDGQTAGFWLPGVRTVRKSAGILGVALRDKPDFQSPPDPAASERYKLAFIITSRVMNILSPSAMQTATTAPAGLAPKNPGGNMAVPVEGKPGYVTSPYSPDKGYIDVRGCKSGEEVKDPYSGKMIVLP